MHGFSGERVEVPQPNQAQSASDFCRTLLEQQAPEMATNQHMNILQEYLASTDQRRAKRMYSLPENASPLLQEGHFPYMERSLSGSIGDWMYNRLVCAFNPGLKHPLHAAYNEYLNNQASASRPLDIRLPETMNEDLPQTPDDFLQELEKVLNHHNMGLTEEERTFLLDEYAYGTDILKKARNATVQTEEEIRAAVDKVYEPGDYSKPLGENEFGVLLVDKVDPSQYWHRNKIDVARGIFWGDSNYKRPGGPPFSDIKIDTKRRVEDQLRKEGRLQAEETITMREIRGVDILNEKSVKVGHLLLANRTFVEYEAGTPGFIIWMGTPVAKSNAFVAPAWGATISKIRLIQPNPARKASLKQATYVLEPQKPQETRGT